MPVMLEEAISFLNIQRGNWYIDCNLGGGGHASEILKKGGKVIGIDLDDEAISFVAQENNIDLEEREGSLVGISENLIVYQNNFSKIDEIVKESGIKEISGVLFDLGISSFQLETPERGFSFSSDAPLDMRMDRSFGATAADLVNGLHEKELTELFLKLGEEPFAKAIASKIVEERSREKITTTKQLADIIKKVKRGEGKIHPATKVFQALRIAVNDELNSLKDTLPKALTILSPGGRLVVISFHSLEDRIVKNFFKEEQDNERVRILTDKPLSPTDEEIRNNPRSRSAKLRVCEKI